MLRFESYRARRVCSNRAATRVNILKCREKRYRPNASICRYFVSSRNLQQTITLPSHGRGRWFDPRIAMSLPHLWHRGYLAFRSFSCKLLKRESRRADSNR